MNTAYFIAKKIQQGKGEDSKVSRPIIRISKVSIILAMIVNIVTIAVVIGFQNEVKNKVTGFGSHLTILRAGDYNAFESRPFERQENLENEIFGIEGINNIQRFAYKPALLQSEMDTTFYSLQEKDTFQIQQEIQGVIIKGVGEEFNWEFFREHLVEGQLPNYSLNEVSEEILISRRIATNLKLQVGDEVSVFYIKSQPIKQKQKVVGIFETGFEEQDRQVVFADIRKIQQMNDWGIKVSFRFADTITSDGQFVLLAEAKGGNGNYRYDWGEGFESVKGITYCGGKDTTIKVVVSDYWRSIREPLEETTIPDTAMIEIRVSGEKNLPCYPLSLNGNRFSVEYLNDDGTQFAIPMHGGKRYKIRLINGKGSHSHYVGGYEILVDDFSNLDAISQKVKSKVVYSSMELANDFRVRSIFEEQEDIFLWLSFLDVNVWIILFLMLIVSIINMGSGLLVLILSKTSFIGLLKALGSTNWQIRKIFLYQTVFIVLRGMFWGNLIGITICLAQQYFTLIPLNPEVYYLNAVPIELNIWYLILLNIGTLVLCTAALIIPSYVITKISPVKAIRFQ